MGLQPIWLFEKLKLNIFEMSIAGMFVVVSCCKSRMLSEGKQPVSFKSCTRILARCDSDRGFFGVQTELNC